MKTVLYQNADWIITMDEERRRYRHADLLISGKEIKAIGKNLKDTLGDTVTIDEVVDASGRVILPGFVNTHHHTWPQYQGHTGSAAGAMAHHHVRDL